MARGLAWTTWCAALLSLHARAAYPGGADGGDSRSDRSPSGSVIIAGEDGSLRVMELRAGSSVSLSGPKASRIADVSMKDKDLRVAIYDEDGSLVLVERGGGARRLSAVASATRFSPDQTRLVFEERVSTFKGGAAIPTPRTAVFSLFTANTVRFPDIGAPEWQASSDRLLGVRQAVEVTWYSPSDSGLRANIITSRVQIDLNTRKVTDLGPGDVQLPAPRGRGIAFVSRGRRARAILLEGGRCSLALDAKRYSVEGHVCSGQSSSRDVKADSSNPDGQVRRVRAGAQDVRWDWSGRWLAFGAFGAERPKGTRPDLLIVSADGKEELRPDSWPRSGSQAPVHTAWKAKKVSNSGDGLVWIDWDRSSKRLVAQDGDGEVTLYDLESRIAIPLGPGQEPQWSPDGTYLLMLVAEDKAGLGAEGARARPKTLPVSWHALAFEPGRAGAPTDLGSLRDVAWVPAGPIQLPPKDP
jgi:hypothetical protein